MTSLLLLLMATATQPVLPADVRDLVERHQSCEHWLGEDGYDAERAREIGRAVRASCPGVNRTRARLLKRYRTPSPARRRLLSLPSLDW